MTELNKQEREALKATSEALVTIRSLASKPVTEESRQVILALAEAFHNIPDYAAGSGAQREANAFLLAAGVEQARQANKHHGLTSSCLAPLKPGKPADLPEL
jgi:hypothetical protein